jgi:hypothetical protein
MDIDPAEFAETEDGEYEDFGPEDVGDGEMTDEDVRESVTKMSERQRSAIQSSRKPGRAQAPTGPKRTHTTTAQAAHTKRNPPRVRAEWKPADSLDAPPPLPGNEARWIRFRVGNDDDQKNFSQKRRSGWVPRTLDTVQEGYYPPTMKHAQLGEIIAVGDLILCERPMEIGIARRRYYKAKLDRQTQAGQRHIRQAERSDHPIDVEHTRGRPTVGMARKRRAPVQGDE